VDAKYAVLLGKIDEDDAIITINKTPIRNLDSLVEKLTQEALLETNSIYTWFNAGFHDPPDLKLYLIHPATASHISKYTLHKPVMVSETPDIYEVVTKPWIESMPASKIAWVRNILEHKKEMESIVFENPDKETGFIVLPDSKWDQTTVENMYLQAIFHTSRVKSLRDLRANDIFMLKQFRTQVQDVVKTRFGVAGGEFRMYVHYQPTYYHFHVHITHLRQGQNQAGTSIGRAHLLNDVIQNLEMDGDYYKNRTMYYTLSADDSPEGALGLYQALVKMGAEALE